MDSEKKCLTPFEAAAILGVNPKSVYKELQAGNIPHVKVGARFIIGREAFFAWLNGNQPKCGAGIAQ